MLQIIRQTVAVPPLKALNIKLVQLYTMTQVEMMFVYGLKFRLFICDFFFEEP